MNRLRALAVATGCLLATPIGLSLWMWAEGARLESPLSRGDRAPVLTGEVIQALPDSTLRRQRLTRAEYALLEPEPMRNGRLLWNPHSYYTWRPGLRERRNWPEHPRRRWMLETNARGWREDEDLGDRERDLWAFFTGDSHADGVCDNHQSFCNLIEAGLRKRFPTRGIDCWNTAKGGYTFYFYLGLLESVLELEPDLFVCTVYGGNDFHGQMALLHAFEPEHPLPRRGPDYRTMLRRGFHHDREAMLQAFNSSAYFSDQPAEQELAVRSAVEVTRELSRVCEAHDIPFLLAYMPSTIDIGASEFTELRAILDLDDEDVEVGARMEAAYLEGLEREGIPVIQLGPVLSDKAAIRWKKDFHLNLEGQRRIARTLIGPVTQALRLE